MLQESRSKWYGQHWMHSPTQSISTSAAIQWCDISPSPALSALTAVFQTNQGQLVSRHFSSSNCSCTAPLAMSGTGLHRPDVLPVTKPTVSRRHQNSKHRPQRGTITHWTHHFHAITRASGFHLISLIFQRCCTIGRISKTECVDFWGRFLQCGWQLRPTTNANSVKYFQRRWRP